jgi:hypothetical protein
MTRSAFTSAAVLVCSFAVTTAAVQAAPQAKAAAQTPAAKAAPATTTPAPAAPAKFVKPIKGRATVDYIIVSGPTKKGSDIVTVMKVKNTSPGSIALFKIDEYWYDKGKPPKVVTGDSAYWRKPFNPGDIIELTLNSPYKGDLSANQYQFSHVNGDIKPTKVKQFGEAAADGGDKKASDKKATATKASTTKAKKK